MLSNDEKVKKVVALFFGNLIVAAAINIFYIPNDLLSGGVAGIAIILNRLFTVNVGLSVLLINIPLFLLAFKEIDKSFTLYSLVNMILFSVLLDLTEGMRNIIVVNDVILSCIFGGIFLGAGMGLIFRNKSSQGGIDIIGILVKRKYGVNIGTTFMLTNLLIVAAEGLVFGIQTALYTIVALYISIKALDKVKVMFNTQKAVIVISECPEKIAFDIMTELKRGVTFLQGEGAYTNAQKKIIYCIVNTEQLPKLQEIVSRNNNTFMSITDLNEVKGQGFKERFV